MRAPECPAPERLVSRETRSPPAGRELGWPFDLLETGMPEFESRSLPYPRLLSADSAAIGLGAVGVRLISLQ